MKFPWGKSKKKKTSDRQRKHQSQNDPHEAPNRGNAGSASRQAPKYRRHFQSPIKRIALAIRGLFSGRKAKDATDQETEIASDVKPPSAATSKSYKRSAVVHNTARSSAEPNSETDEHNARHDHPLDVKTIIPFETAAREQDRTNLPATEPERENPPLQHLTRKPSGRLVSADSFHSRDGSTPFAAPSVDPMHASQSFYNLPPRPPTPPVAAGHAANAQTSSPAPYMPPAQMPTNYPPRGTFQRRVSHPSAYRPEHSPVPPPYYHYQQPLPPQQPHHMMQRPLAPAMHMQSPYANDRLGRYYSDPSMDYSSHSSGLVPGASPASTPPPAFRSGVVYGGYYPYANQGPAYYMHTPPPPPPPPPPSSSTADHASMHMHHQRVTEWSEYSRLDLVPPVPAHVPPPSAMNDVSREAEADADLQLALERSMHEMSGPRGSNAIDEANEMALQRALQESMEDVTRDNLTTLASSSPLPVTASFSTATEVAQTSAAHTPSVPATASSTETPSPRKWIVREPSYLLPGGRPVNADKPSSSPPPVNYLQRMPSDGSMAVNGSTLHRTPSVNRLVHRIAFDA